MSEAERAPGEGETCLSSVEGDTKAEYGKEKDSRLKVVDWLKMSESKPISS